MGINYKGLAMVVHMYERLSDCLMRWRYYIYVVCVHAGRCECIVMSQRGMGELNVQKYL